MAGLRAPALPLAFAALACGPQAPIVPVDSSGADEAGTEDASEPDDSADGDADDNDTVSVDYDIGGNWPTPDCGDANHPCLVDILVVVDNSGTMADPQRALAASLVQLVGRLEVPHYPTLHSDVQIMFTTTDMGHPLCEKYEKPDYTPSMGAPISTGCNARIDRFTGLGGDPPVRSDVCTDFCPVDLTPADPFVAFSGSDSTNVSDGPAIDVDGDGVADSRAAQAVACLAPQGIDGCGYEQPLETMLQALDPSAPWNSGARPFLREGSMVMIVLATDELDCSMDDPVLDPQYWEPAPGGGSPAPSSAACWNAGMSCAGPDADGVYSNCVTTEGPLQPTSRYANYLLDDLEGHRVFMLALTGVPLATALNADAPYEPVAGGVNHLVLREWRDGMYPEGDLVPQDVEDGIEVEDKTWLYKAGPGCTEPVPNSDAFVQAIPNPRVHEVCQALDVAEDNWHGTRCCIDSICDPAPSLLCIEGWIVGGPEVPLPDG